MMMKVDLRRALPACLITAMLVALVLFGCAGDALTRDELAALPPDIVLGFVCPTAYAAGQGAGCRSVTAADALASLERELERERQLDREYVARHPQKCAESDCLSAFRE